MIDRMMRVAGRGSDGLAKAIRTNGEGYVMSNTMGGEPYANQVINVELTTTSPATLISEASAIYLENLVFVTNSPDLGISIYKSHNVREDTIVGDLNPIHRGSMPLRPNNLVSGNSSLFEVNQYDEANNRFKFTLRKPIMFPKGFLIRTNNAASEPALISIRVHGVKYSD